MTYLSFAPAGPARGAHHRRAVADRPAGRRRLRRDLAPGARGATRRYFARYPDDRARVRGHRAAGWTTRTSGCRRATGSPSRRFRQLGHVARRQRRASSTSTTSLELPFGSRAFLARRRGGRRGSRGNPIYATLHESSYADGVPDPLVRRTARLPDEIAGRGCFTRRARLPAGCGRTTAACTRTRAAAELLAEHPWPRLYDAEQLGRERGPGRGDDLRQRPVRGAGLRGGDGRARSAGLRPWITNEYEHNGLRADGERVLGRLIDLVRGRA